MNQLKSVTPCPYERSITYIFHVGFVHESFDTVDQIGISVMCFILLNSNRKTLHCGTKSPSTKLSIHSFHHMNISWTLIFGNGLFSRTKLARDLWNTQSWNDWNSRKQSRALTYRPLVYDWKESDDTQLQSWITNHYRSTKPIFDWGRNVQIITTHSFQQPIWDKPTSTLPEWSDMTYYRRWWNGTWLQKGWFGLTRIKTNFLGYVVWSTPAGTFKRWLAKVIHTT